MALFFDAEWFDARLGERGLSRRVLAAAAGMDEAELAFAELLGVAPAEAASRAGVSTPVPGQGAAARIAALERRVAVLEAEAARLRRG
jgi:hypothetical protein